MSFIPPQPIEIESSLQKRLITKPMYFINGFSKERRVFLHVEAWTRLCRAIQRLPPLYAVMLWDGYRSRECQRIMFDWMRGEIRKQYPMLSEAENYEKARKYMSPPSRVGEQYCPPHLSGGAIDLTLVYADSGEEVEMGTPFDDCTERAHALYFEESSHIRSEQELLIRDHRRLLRRALESEGFVAYEHEWWHFDYGDIFWSRTTGRPACLGPLFGDAEGPEDF